MLVSLGSVVALTLLAALHIAQGLDRLADAGESQRRINVELEHAHFLESSGSRANLLLEQYLDIPDEARVAEIRALRHEAAARRKELRTITTNPSVTQSLDALEALAPQRSALAEQIIQSAWGGSNEGALLMLRQRRNELDQRARIHLDEIVLIEGAAMAESVLRARQTAADLLITTSVLLLGIVLLTLAISVLSARRIVRRLVPLLDMADRVSRGDFAARVPVGGVAEIASLSSAFNRMAAELEELDKAKDEFVALASHQLRTPATAVKANVAMLLDGYFGELTAEQREYMKDAFDANERQLHVIDEILDVARARTGRLTLQKARVDMGALVAETIAEHRFGMDAKGQHLEFAAPDEPIHALVDARKMRMVADNLISNASKYTPDGGRVRVSVLSREGRVIIEVSDTGVGIAPEDRDRLFRKFSRIDNPLSIASGGTGLGLYLAAEIVRLHGGEISVQSKVGEGSVFRIEISVE